MRQILTIAICSAVLSGCGQVGNPVAPLVDERGELREVTNEDAWMGLLRPVAVHAGADGSVYAADLADGKIHVFGRDGSTVLQFGSVGDGPGEHRGIRDFIVSDGVVSVLDGKLNRMVQWSPTGRYLGTVSTVRYGDEMVAGLGSTNMVVASTARWSMRGASDAVKHPLARVINMDNGGVTDLGQRQDFDNPFAAHIANFVLPAGTADGRVVWLAYLNSPVVARFDVATGAQVEIVRTLPFAWRAIAEDVDPTDLKVDRKGRKLPPFDVVSRGIATDLLGRAFVLTALESSEALGGEPGRMAIDILPTHGDGPVRRWSVTGNYSGIAVSPDGSRLYLLASDVGRIREFEVPL